MTFIFNVKLISSAAKDETFFLLNIEWRFSRQVSYTIPKMGHRCQRAAKVMKSQIENSYSTQLIK